MLEEVRTEYETEESSIVISGCIGPRGDGYVPAELMSVDQAESYHSQQVETFAGTAADLVTAITMNYAEEAIGLARAAENAELPVVISLTVETDGRLPTGQSLGDAIKQIDAATSGYPSYFMRSQHGRASAWLRPPPARRLPDTLGRRHASEYQVECRWSTSLGLLLPRSERT